MNEARRQNLFKNFGERKQIIRRDREREREREREKMKDGERGRRKQSLICE